MNYRLAKIPCKIEKFLWEDIVLVTLNVNYAITPTITFQTSPNQITTDSISKNINFLNVKILKIDHNNEATIELPNIVDAPYIVSVNADDLIDSDPLLQEQKINLALSDSLILLREEIEFLNSDDRINRIRRSEYRNDPLDGFKKGIIPILNNIQQLIVKIQGEIKNV